MRLEDFLVWIWIEEDNRISQKKGQWKDSNGGMKQPNQIKN